MATPIVVKQPDNVAADATGTVERQDLMFQPRVPTGSARFVDDNVVESGDFDYVYNPDTGNYDRGWYSDFVSGDMSVVPSRAGTAFS